MQVIVDSSVLPDSMEDGQDDAKQEIEDLSRQLLFNAPVSVKPQGGGAGGGGELDIFFWCLIPHPGVRKLSLIAHPGSRNLRV